MSSPQYPQQPDPQQHRPPQPYPQQQYPQQPYPQQPYPGPQGQPGFQGYPQYGGYPPPPPPPRRRRGRIFLLIAVPVVVVAVVAAGVVVYLSQRRTDDVSHESGARSNDAATQLHDAMSDGRLTGQELQGIDPTDLWWAEFRTMLQQPVLHTVHEYTHHATGEVVRHQITFDFRNHQFNYEDGAYKNFVNGVSTEAIGNRCVGGKQYVAVKSASYHAVPGYHPPLWKQETGGDCDRIPLNESDQIADCLGTGGLTAKQADLMISDLRKKDEFLQARQATVVTRNNKQYLRFAVEITPVKLSNDLYYGMQRFMFAFKKTGIDPESYPYTYRGRSADGKRIIMYVDPVTLLPAYEQLSDTARFDDETGVRKEEEYAASQTEDTWVERIEFDFTQKKVVPQNLKDFKDIPMHWPEEKYPPHVGPWQP